MKIIYGTTNESKVQHMQDMLGGLDIEIVGLSSIGRVNAKIDESGSSHWKTLLSRLEHISPP